MEQVRYVNRILRRGVDLNDGVRIYQFRNLPHAFAEIVESTRNQNAALAENFGFRPSPDADHMAPVVAAAILFADFSAHWKNFGKDESCIQDAMKDLERDGLYDKKIGKNVVITDDARALFEK